MREHSREPTEGPTPLPPGDLGYYYDPRVVAGQHGEIRISNTVEQQCSCGGRPPYMRLSGVADPESSEPQWCICRPYRVRVSRVNRLIEDSWIPPRFRFCFLDSFSETYDDGQPVRGSQILKGRISTVVDRYKLDPARRAAQGNGTRKESMPKGLFLWGVPGNGKTHLGCAALNELIFSSALPGKFVSISREFFQRLRHTFDEGSATRGQAVSIMDTLGSVPFLVIDDLGVQRDTDWEVETLYNLVDSRYVNGKLTIVTTNKNVTEIKNLAGGRIYSRFLEMCSIIHMTAPDYREKRYRDEVEL